MKLISPQGVTIVIAAAVLGAVFLAPALKKAAANTPPLTVDTTVVERFSNPRYGDKLSMPFQTEFSGTLVPPSVDKLEELRPLLVQRIEYAS